MFQVGDKVFYPMHGAGIIKAIEQKEILGEITDYCVISIPICNMDIMVPLKKMEQLGVRSIIDPKTLNEILYDFHHEKPNDSLPWRERYNLNMQKIKSGDMHDTTDVIRDLLYRSMEKSLNSTEKQMLHQAQKNVISELILIKNISEHQAAELLKLTS
ncbi:CarD family transcriptional regulator [Bacillus massilinigeriensis]|uniref:CarD family transcriptional regulator n=1 Tax=Bacillus massilionigeriensis TaxID=1805475 RepID=UPI00096B153B|nr:CarD family transcriptional regulator [Bacillus massilionigeriensis]